MLKFDFLEKGLGIAFPTDFVYDFSRKMFLLTDKTSMPNWIYFLRC